MSVAMLAAQFDRRLAAAASGNGAWRPALESLLLLAGAAGPGDEALLAGALRETARALAVNARRATSRRAAAEPEASLR